MRGNLFGTGDRHLLALWDRLMHVQAAVTIGFELPAYFTSAAWRRARSVLDLGTGNGCYLKQIADHFPEKQYLGVDLSSELIEIARQEHRAGRIEYRCLDLFDISGTFDSVIMRAVVQHLPDHGRVVAHLEQLLAVNGAVLISDSDIDGLLFWPEAPKLTALFRVLDESQRRRCGSRGKVLDHFLAHVRSSPGWRIADSRKVVIPSTVCDNLKAIREQCALAIELLQRTGAAEVNGVQEEWEAWCGLPTAYAQFGMELIQIVKVGDVAAGP